MGDRYASRWRSGGYGAGELRVLDSVQRGATRGDRVLALRGYKRRGLVYGGDARGDDVLAVTFALVAGIRSVAWTDALQVLVMLVTATVAVLLVVSSLGGFGELFGRVAEEHPGALSVPGGGFFSISVFLGLTLPWFFFSLSNPQVSQRLFMVGTMRNLRRMLLGVSGDRVYLHAGGGAMGVRGAGPVPGAGVCGPGDAGAAGL